jgi:hypothetical protein
VCAYCDAKKKRDGDRIFARVGTRGILPEWKIRQIERDRQSAAEVIAMFAEGQ